MSGEDGTVDQSRESPEVDQSEESHVVGGPPVTGEHGVDRIISDLQSQLRGDGTDAVTALTEAHRRLQARLSEPGPTPPTG